MVSFFTTINNGNYIASSSSYYSANPPWYAFDKTNTQWASAYNTPSDYSTSLPYNANSTAPSTTDVNGNVYLGAWLQIQLPVPITLSYYIFQGSFSVTTWGPARFVLLGSRDGVNWSLVDSQYGLSWSTSYQTKTCTPQNTRSYTYFRYVCLQVVGNPGNTEVGELILYGTADTSPTLTIAPATTFNTSVATPSLTGIAASGVYVPQDFSSSGLNIPAYVVSNTATVANTVAFSSFGPFAGEGSLYFPGGTGQYVNFGQPTQLAYNWTSYDFTLEAWVFPMNYTTNQNIFARDYEQVFYINSDGTLRYYIAGVTTPASGVFQGGAVTRNQWNHLVVSWSQSAQTLYLSVNGSVTSVALTAGTPTYAGTRNFVMGSWSGTNGYLNMNVANLRFTRGLALYTTTFTPPTAPLQPIQGTTQAGLPYGTVLLLRNAPAPGRIQTTRLTGSNSGSVLSFPPAAMTGYSTLLNPGYGQGTYVASASNEFDSGTNTLWHTFDKSTSTLWTGDGSSYTSGNYVKSPPVTTVDVNGTSYQGEWIQLQMPSSIVLSSYQINSPGSQGPSLFYLLGSRDGVNWSLVDQRSGQVTNGTYLTYSVSSGQAFTYFRLVTNKISGGSSYVQIYEIVFNGQIEGLNINPDGKVGLGVVNPTRALEVAGDVVCAGTLSAGNPLMFRNRIINGDMRIAQRGTSFTVSGYNLDRWVASLNIGNMTIAQSTSVPLGQGFSNSVSIVMNVTVASGTGGAWYFRQSIEGYNVSDFGFGNPAGAGTFTVSFWLTSSLAGTMTVTLMNTVDTRSYLTTISVGNYWQKYTLTIQVDAGATSISTTTASALSLYFVFQSGTSTTTTNTWLASQTFWLSNTTNYMVNGTTINITGVQLERGTVASPFEVRPYATELALCQRYYQKSYQQGDYAGTATSTNGIIAVSAVNIDSIAGTRFNVPMRAAPGAITIYSTAGTAGKATVFNGGADTSAITTIYATNVGIGYLYISAANLTQGNGYRYQYVADAEI